MDLLHPTVWGVGIQLQLEWQKKESLLKYIYANIFERKEILYGKRVIESAFGGRNEGAVNGEGRIAYDIRFYAVVLRSREKIRLIINVEAQKSWYPGYKIPTRGIFYGARMISAQLGTEFCDSNYDDIKKVYSIWLCFGVPDYIGNAISEYRMEKRDVVPGFPDVMSRMQSLRRQMKRQEKSCIASMGLSKSPKPEI